MKMPAADGVLRQVSIWSSFALAMLLLFWLAPPLRAAWTAHELMTSGAVLVAAVLWGLFWHRKDRPNIPPQAARTFDWSSDKAVASLQGMLSYCEATCTDAYAWYGRAKSECRWWARSARMVAIVLTALAGVLPVLSEIFKSPVPRGHQAREFARSETTRRVNPGEVPVVDLELVPAPPPQP